MSNQVELVHVIEEIGDEVGPVEDSTVDETVGLVVGSFPVVWGYYIHPPRNRNCSAEERSPARKHTAWFDRERIAPLIQLGGQFLRRFGPRHD